MSLWIVNLKAEGPRYGRPRAYKYATVAPTQADAEAKVRAEYGPQDQILSTQSVMIDEGVYFITSGPSR